MPCAYFALMKQSPAKQPLHSNILFQVSVFVFSTKIILCKEITAKQDYIVLVVTKARYLKINMKYPPHKKIYKKKQFGLSVPFISVYWYD